MRTITILETTTHILMANPAKLPPIDAEKSCHDWNIWGKTRGKGVNVPPRVYEQHVPRAEVVKPRKVKRK